MSAPLWGRAPELPRLERALAVDVCVVGLGGSGLSALARLAGAPGLRVAGIDAVGVGAGAAGRNGGFLLAGPAAFHHRLRAQVGAGPAKELYETSVEARDRIAAAEPTARMTGSLRTPGSDEERADVRDHFEALADDDLPGELLADGSLLVPGDGTFDPLARCLRLAHEVADRVRLLGDARVASLSPERAVTDDGAEIRAEVFLVCVDGGVETLLPALVGRARTVRLQMLATAPALDVSVDHAVYHRFGYDYWQQRPDGRIALGGGRDVGGEDEEGGAPGTSEAVQAYLERLLRDRVGTRAPVERRWSGRVALSADDLPIVEELEPGVFVAGAYSGTGNVLGALAGEALAELARGRARPSLVQWLDRARREAVAAVDADGPGAPEGGGSGQ